MVLSGCETMSIKTKINDDAELYLEGYDFSITLTKTSTLKLYQKLKKYYKQQRVKQ